MERASKELNEILRIDLNHAEALQLSKNLSGNCPEQCKVQ